MKPSDLGQARATNSLSLPEPPQPQANTAPAPLLLRLMAWLVDTFILLGIYSVAAVPAAHLPHDSIIWIMVFFWLYYTVLEASPLRGTIGKRLFRLRVVDDNGQRIGLLRSGIRALLRIFTLSVFSIGFLLALFIPGRKTLHDLLAGTLVVRD